MIYYKHKTTSMEKDIRHLVLYFISHQLSNTSPDVFRRRIEYTLQTINIHQLSKYHNRDKQTEPNRTERNKLNNKIKITAEQKKNTK